MVLSLTLPLQTNGATAAQGTAGTTPCGETFGANARRLNDTNYQVVFKPSPLPIPVGQHFQIDFALCPIGQAAMPSEVFVDAQMPEHRHGMNYRPEVRRVGAGLYRAEGLMFHMPGRWELVFELRAAGTGGTPQRLVQSLQVG